MVCRTNLTSRDDSLNLRSATTSSALSWSSSSCCCRAEEVVFLVDFFPPPRGMIKKGTILVLVGIFFLFVSLFVVNVVV